MGVLDLGASSVAVILTAFLLGGVSKGGVGFGLPLIAVPLLATVLPVTTAIALTAVPILASNVWQAFSGGRQWEVLRRLWPVLLALVFGTAVGAQILTRVDQATIQAVVGAIVLAFVATQALRLRLHVPPGAEKWCGPGVGAISGLLGGVASMFGPPMIMYLVALRLPAGLFVSALGVFYLLGVVPLYATLIVKGFIGREEAILSTLACIPLAAGIMLGIRLRAAISQEWFYRAILVVLTGVGISLVYRGVS